MDTNRKFNLGGPMKQYAILCFPTSGPAFGGGYGWEDLHVGHSANTGPHSHTDIFGAYA